MRSGRIVSSSFVTAAKKRAVSQPGPSRSTSDGKNGVCGTPNAPTISAKTSSWLTNAMTVVPAQAGTHQATESADAWVPAFAGTTAECVAPMCPILLLRVLVGIDQLAGGVFWRIKHRHGRGILELHDVGALDAVVLDREQE